MKNCDKEEGMSGMPNKSQFVLFFLGFLLIHALVFAQEPVLVSYERNFLRVSLTDKDNLLRDAATDEKAPEFIGELYEFALDFILQNIDILQNDPDFTALTITVTKGLSSSECRAATDKLWQVFSRFSDTLIRVEVVNALAVLGAGNAKAAENLNQYLINQNSRFRSGIPPEYPILSVCIVALSAIGDGSSFPALFSVMTSGYPEPITREAAAALNAIPGDFRQYLIDVIRRNPPAEKFAAFNAVTGNRKFTDAERAEIAAIALETGLDFFAGNRDEEAAINNMRYAAVRVLRDVRWTSATSLVVKHFYRVQQDYNSGSASHGQFVEAITCLGAMGSSEAAQVLALQLGFLNSRMERNGEYDDAVTLRAVQALGEIGDKIAFDYLLHISYLPYPEHIQNAAKEALNRLKW
jgi:HEAT repeat protein